MSAGAALEADNPSGMQRMKASTAADNVEQPHLADPTLPREDAFARVLRHSAFKAAVARGAVPLWMPRLEPSVAAEIEAKRLHFTDARDGVAPEGREVAPLGPFDRSRVRKWLDAMEAELAPIRTWLL